MKRYRGASTSDRLPIGTAGQVLTVSAGLPAWSDPATSGTVTSVTLTMPTGFSVAGSPIISTGTLAVTTTLDGMLKGTGSGIAVATAGTDYEAALGNPSSDGYMLTSSAAGARAWAAPLTNPMAAIGDLIVGGTAGAATRLPMGTALQILRVNSAGTAEEFATPAWMTNPMTTAGDLITGGSSGTPARLAMGTALQVLRVNAGATALEFAAVPADVTGPASSTDNRLAIFSSTTGKVLKDSTTLTAAAGTITGSGAVGLTAGGSNQDVTLIPSGTGSVKTYISPTIYSGFSSSGVLTVRRDGDPRPRINMQDLGGNGIGYLDFYTYTSQTVPTVRWSGADIGSYMGEHIFYSEAGGSANTALVERFRIGVNVTASGALVTTATTSSTSTTTGALKVAGGAGIAGATYTATLNVGTGTTISQILSGSASLDFGSIAAGAEATLTVTVTGAATTNTPSVSLGFSAALEDGIVVKQAWVSAANTVSVRVRNETAGSIDPAAVTVRATVISF